jgi:hypothetical protein
VIRRSADARDDTSEALARARRDVARRLHPDLGGDVAQYLAALADVDHRFGMDACGAAGRSTVGQTGGRLRPLTRAASLTVRTARRSGRYLRSRLPRGAPGARRWINL